MNLPRLQNEPAYKKELVQFDGYNNSLKPSETEYIDGKNLCSDAEPCLTQVPNKTYIENNVQGRNGMIELDGTLYYFCGTNLYVRKEGAEAAEEYLDVVTNTPKVLTFFNDNIIILPDQKYFDGSTINPIENHYVSETNDITFTANEIKSTTTTFNGFAVGDGVKISGSSESGNNKTSIIRGVSADHKTLTFDDNIFTPVIETAEISITREMPLMDFMVEHENRLWGCRGSTIYACKLGDFKNWNVFEGLSTDSYATDVGSPGDFTGIIKTPNMVTFSKVDCIHKLYGNKPSNFEITSAIPCSGVNTNCHNSICNIQGTAYYVSKNSVMRYAGGLPEPIGYKLSREFDPTHKTGIEVEWGEEITVDSNLNTMCYGNGKFVGLPWVSGSYWAVTSIDGVNWTTHAIPEDTFHDTYPWIAMCYGNGKYVGISNDSTEGKILTSPDGEEWQLLTVAGTGSLGNCLYSNICYGNGKFVIISPTSANNRVLVSTDGINWNIYATGYNESWRSICWSEEKNLFVAGSPAILGSTNRVMTSPDGINWTAGYVTEESDPNFIHVEYGNGIFVASDGSTNLMISSDGVNWEHKVIPVIDGLYRLYFGGGYFIAAGATKIYISKDGVEWTVHDAPYGYNAISYGNGKWMCSKRYVVNALTNIVMELKITDNVDTQAAAGTDGRKYYLSIYLDGKQQYVVYDTWLNRWDKINDSLIYAFAYSHSKGALYELRDTQISMYNTYDAIDWYLTTKVLFAHNKKLYKKISVIADIKVPGTFKIYIKRDNGAWELLGDYTLTETGYKTFKSFLRLKRDSAFQLKIAGECRCDLYGIEYEWIEGSDK